MRGSLPWHLHLVRNLSCNLICFFQVKLSRKRTFHQYVYRSNWEISTYLDPFGHCAHGGMPAKRIGLNNWSASFPPPPPFFMVYHHKRLLDDITMTTITNSSFYCKMLSSLSLQWCNSVIGLTGPLHIMWYVHPVELPNRGYVENNINSLVSFLERLSSSRRLKL